MGGLIAALVRAHLVTYQQGPGTIQGEQRPGKERCIENPGPDRGHRVASTRRLLQRDRWLGARTLTWTNLVTLLPSISVALGESPPLSEGQRWVCLWAVEATHEVMQACALQKVRVHIKRPPKCVMCMDDSALAARKSGFCHWKVNT
ncbi:hypothetical protein TREES_T100004252 [Tupaia chinensis]|uniref:Uncharacterized protein n=1 Tax=Tupaia chinensis TaxID=246437 RepID=L9KGM1_TUPCH|nr:hypothetical protein TREES_T100004252 [Tupaia chinensis]